MRLSAVHHPLTKEQGTEAGAAEAAGTRGREEGATGDASNSPTEREVPDGADAAVAAAEGEGGPLTTRLISGRTGGAIPTKVARSGCVTISFNDFAFKQFV